MPLPSTVANLDEVEEFAQHVPLNYLRCRVNKRHILDEDSPECVVKHSRKNRTWDEQGPCIVCGQTVHRVWNDNGDVISTHVDYDDPYLMPRGTGRVDAHGNAIMRVVYRKRRNGPRARRLQTVKAG